MITFSEAAAPNPSGKARKVRYTRNGNVETGVIKLVSKNFAGVCPDFDPTRVLPVPYKYLHFMESEGLDK